MIKQNPQIGASRAFTLIELMVVMAIIAILASILMPVFASALERGKQASCLENLHQLDLSITLYSNDSDGFAPCYTSNELFLSNGGPLPSNSDDPKLLTQVINPYLKSKQAWFCPSDRMVSKPVFYLGIVHTYMSYNVVTFDPVDRGGLPHLNLDSAPTGKFLVGDAVAPLFDSDSVFVTGEPPYPSLSNHGATISQYVNVGGSALRVSPRFLSGALY